MASGVPRADRARVQVWSLESEQLDLTFFVTHSVAALGFGMLKRLVGFLHEGFKVFFQSLTGTL